MRLVPRLSCFMSFAFSLQLIGNFSRERNKKVGRSLFSSFMKHIAVALDIDGKEIYKNVLIVLVHFSFLTSSLPSTSSLLKLPNKH